MADMTAVIRRRQRPAYPAVVLEVSKRTGSTRAADDPERAAPRSWRRFESRYPEVAAAYDRLREACGAAGSLDRRTIALVKLAISVGRGSTRTVHAHSKKALRLGVAPEDLRHLVLTALPTIGLPATLDALAWVEESIAEEQERI